MRTRFMLDLDSKNGSTAATPQLGEAAAQSYGHSRFASSEGLEPNGATQPWATGLHAAPQSALPSPEQVEEARQLRQQGLQAARSGDYATAIALFDHLLTAIFPNAADYSNRGLLHFQQGHCDQALADYNRAIRLNDQLASIYNNRANYYATQGQFALALADYSHALDLNPYNVRAWLNQGITLRDLGQYDRAIASFDWALRFGQLQDHLYAERGRTYHLWGDWNCAIADYHRALQHQQGKNCSAVPNNSPLSSTQVCLRDKIKGWLDALTNPFSPSDRG